MGMKANTNASMHFRKAAIMNPTMATALSPTRLHAFRFKNGAENTRSRRDPGPVEGILHSKGCRSARAVSEAARHLHRARLIFNVRKGITADEADNKLNLKSPGRVEYFPMVFEKGQWALYMSPGDGYLYHARKPGRKVKVSQPSPLRECMTLGDGQDEIDVTPSPDAGTSKLHKTLLDHGNQIAKHSEICAKSIAESGCHRGYLCSSREHQVEGARELPSRRKAERCNEAVGLWDTGVLAINCSGARQIDGRAASRTEWLSMKSSPKRRVNG